MHYYKGVLIVGKKLKKQRERIIYTRGEDITTALNVVRKIRYAKWNTIDEITHDEYIKGILKT